jgi:dihydropteroate synthase
MLDGAETAATFEAMLGLKDLARLVEEHGADLEAKVASFELRGQPFAAEAGPHLMGVVNLSPDSWYRESVCLHADAAIERGLRLTVEGARIIDVGAESTLAHAALVDPTAQTGALLPVVKGLASSNVLVSVETYHPVVAEACLEAGASVLNLTGTVGTEAFYKLAAEYQAGVIICYVQGDHVRAVGDFDFAGDHTAALHEYFSRQIDLAVQCGVKRIWIDPGMGFYYRNLQDSSVRVRHQMKTFLNTFRLRQLGWPVCHALPHAFEYFEEEVRCAEPFFAVLALFGQTDLLRTHEVARVRGVVRTLGAWL